MALKVAGQLAEAAVVVLLGLCLYLRNPKFAASSPRRSGPSKQGIADGRALSPPAASLAALLQGPAVRMLSAGLMLGSGLGVVLPEGFHAFAEGSRGGPHTGFPEWFSGAALLAGFVGMLVLQLQLQGGNHTHERPAVAVAGTGTRAVAGWRAPDEEGADAGSGGRGAEVVNVNGDGDGADGSYSQSNGGWRRRREGGYKALPSAVAADVEVAAAGRYVPLPPASAVATVPGAAPGLLELSRRHGGSSGAAAHVSVSEEPPTSDSYTCTADTLQPSASTPSKPACSACSNSPSFPVAIRDGNLRIAATAASATVATAAVARAGGAGGGGGGVSSAQLALVGLLTHSTADGLAVGAASIGGGGGGGPSALSLTVAAAIMMHKLPVTLGLTSYLREAGWRRRSVLQALIAFSASAPVAAVATFYLLGLLLTPGGGGGGGGGTDVGVGGQVVALVVLFSGGTFLAAATQHILPAALAAAGAVPPPSSGSDSSGGSSGGVIESNSRLEAQEESAAMNALDGRREAGNTVTVAAVRGGGGLSLIWLTVGALLPLLIAALLPD
ncbi:hypothetical protein VOLCADRAFT_107259 [Volvox carteri f. nagariensis]|uniref:Uncharacterized protein n=1 Tax=Volvox carteri f. nagariensis TaxID=3068 RepID=D8UCW0_VOLCA|nr:uncharacterized protein VOLCADRAFT_107259 [Volvox carteri f. nagariensis]EFJ42458.1 hypothetical protein VOLCADRAFT_107259 [Volvox carteri f. nagariensis]|eukprot:XP_002956521.1 hypothetical protein VOLCADRAFT_107259 [Volvox carteri f. nagariensis]